MTPIKKELRWKKLEKKELGNFQRLTLRALKDFPDKYVTVMYSIPSGPCRQLRHELRAKAGVKLSFVHVLNKMIALAIAENPPHNRILLDSSLYEMEGVHLSNIYLLPGAEQYMTNLVLDNPHLKSLEEIAREMESLRVQKQQLYERKAGEFSRGALFFFKLLYASKLNKIVSERLFYRVAFELGMFSNITLSNQVYEGRTGVFTVFRSITPVVNGLVIHTTGTQKRPCVENDAVVAREMLPLTITHDHRVLHGIHAHHFGLSLERIAAHPEKYIA